MQTSWHVSNRERALLHDAGTREPAFPEAEYRARLERVRREMEARGVDTLIVSDPANLCYLSGYTAAWYQDGRPRAWAPSSCIAIHGNADDYAYFEDLDELILNRITSAAVDTIVCGVAYPEILPAAVARGSVVEDGLATWGDPASIVAQTLKKRGWLDGSIGLELWSYRPCRGYSEELQRRLAEAGARRFVDGSDVVNAARRLKSPAELACVRAAARIADVGIEALARALRPGISEIELCAEAEYAMARVGGENAGIPRIIASGARSHCLHALASRRRIEPGDIVNVDLCGVYHRYHANVARCFSIGDPGQELRDFVERTNRVFRAAREELRPGLGVRELLESGERAARRQGIWDERWWFGGYELGIAFPPDWVGNYAWDHATDLGDDVLEAGFVSNFEFNFYMPQGRGIRELIDTFEVSEDSAQFIQKFPIDLVIAE